MQIPNLILNEATGFSRSSAHYQMKTCLFLHLFPHQLYPFSVASYHWSITLVNLKYEFHFAGSLCGKFPFIYL